MVVELRQQQGAAVASSGFFQQRPATRWLYRTNRDLVFFSSRRRSPSLLGGTDLMSFCVAITVIVRFLVNKVRSRNFTLTKKNMIDDILRCPNPLERSRLFFSKIWFFNHDCCLCIHFCCIVGFCFAIWENANRPSWYLNLYSLEIYICICCCGGGGGGGDRGWSWVKHSG